MATDLTNYTGVKAEIKALYNELLTTTQDNVFFKETLTQTQTALDNLSISDEKKAGLLIEFYAQITNNTITATFQNALLILDKAEKLPKEIELLIADITFRNQQKDSLVNDNTRANAINAKDVVLKQAQYDLAIADKSVKDYQLSTILPQEYQNLIKDGTIKTNQAGLITRQTTAYNDNLRVEEAKCLKDVTFAYAIGGTVPPSELQTQMLNAVAAISI